MSKNSEIAVKDVLIRTMTKDGVDFICITDIAKHKNPIDPNGVIANWMRNRETVEFWVYGKHCTTLVLTPSNSMGLESRQGSMHSRYHLQNGLMRQEPLASYLKQGVMVAHSPKLISPLSLHLGYRLNSNCILSRSSNA